MFEVDAWQRLLPERDRAQAKGEPGGRELRHELLPALELRGASQLGILFSHTAKGRVSEFKSFHVVRINPFVG